MPISLKFWHIHAVFLLSIATSYYILLLLSITTRFTTTDFVLTYGENKIFFIRGTPKQTVGILSNVILGVQS